METNNINDLRKQVIQRAKEMRKEHPSLRVGQAHMNALTELDPEVAKAIPSDVDPFYDDRKLWRFLSEL